MPHEYETDELDEGGCRKCRRLAATVNDLAQDHVDLQLAASILGRNMSGPRAWAWAILQKVAGIVRHQEVTLSYCDARMDQLDEVIVWSACDWVGCWDMRRSVSGGGIALCGGVLRMWARRQATVALSSGGVEFYIVGKAAVEVLAVRSMLSDLGWTVRPRYCVDVSAAQGMASGHDIGRARRLDVRFLWLQQTVRSGA